MPLLQSHQVRGSFTLHPHGGRKFLNDKPQIPINNLNQYMRDKTNAQVVAADNKPVLPAPSDYRVVDLGRFVDLQTTAEQKEAMVRQVLKCAMETGSFNITGHGVSPELLERLDRHANGFFDLPLEQKKAYTRPDGENRGGFVALGAEKVDAVYYRDNDKGQSRDQREVFSAVYPEGSSINVAAPSAFQDAIHEYLAEMKRVESVLLELLTEALNLAKGLSLPADYLEARGTGDATGLLRCSRYTDEPKTTIADKQSKLGAHADWDTFTIIQSRAAGLQEIHDGQWRRVPVRPDELHVVIGETLHLWSNELFVANIHRVTRETSVTNRTSYPYFGGSGEPGNPGAGIAPICSENETPLFEGTLSQPQHLENNMRLYFGSDKVSKAAKAA